MQCSNGYMVYSYVGSSQGRWTWRRTVMVRSWWTHTCECWVTPPGRCMHWETVCKWKDTHCHAQVHARLTALVCASQPSSWSDLWCLCSTTLSHSSGGRAARQVPGQGPEPPTHSWASGARAVWIQTLGHVSIRRRLQGSSWHTLFQVTRLVSDVLHSLMYYMRGVHGGILTKKLFIYFSITYL